MRYLLSRNSRSILTRLAQERTLCAFDFDGTLAPIAEHPDQAGMRAPTRRLLARLAGLYSCVIVSGRSRSDVLAKLNGVNVTRVIGNHGAEMEAATRSSSQRIRRWKTALEHHLGPLPGLWIEDKGMSLAVHYRQSPHKVQARRLVLAAARTLPGVRVFGGKQVVNLVPAGAPHKGDALAGERVRLGCEWVLYVGDDDNDEDAFALDGDIVSVRVGRKQRSHASYYLRTQPEVDELIALLVKLRTSAAAIRKA